MDKNTPAAPAKDNTASILAAGAALADIKTEEGFLPVVIIPEGYKAQELTLTPLKALPDHIRQSVRLDDAASFIAYVKGFRTPTTRIFATAAKLSEVKPGNSGGTKFTALLDYHEGGPEQKHRRVAHVADYPVPLSMELSIWLGKNGVGQGQMDFVEFIEQNSRDVISPSSASLMELALNFESKSEVSFASKIDRTKGGKNLTFTEKVDAGAPTTGQVSVPESLTISIPVFEGGKTYPFNARMEYRVNNGRLTIAYHLQRPQEVFRTALKDLREEIGDALELEILTGYATPQNDEE